MSGRAWCECEQKLMDPTMCGGCTAMNPRDQKSEAWNRCDVCGQFIALDDFDRGAVRRCVTPDSHFSRETWETLCIEHSPPNPDRDTRKAVEETEE